MKVNIQSNNQEKGDSYPPLQPVDYDVVGFVRDVECHQTEVGEIPKKLWKENQVKMEDNQLSHFNLKSLYGNLLSQILTHV